MGDLQATMLTGRETTLPAAAVEAFKKSLRGQLIAPDDERYAEARQVWNANIDRRPGLICRCYWGRRRRNSWRHIGTGGWDVPPGSWAGRRRSNDDH